MDSGILLSVIIPMYNAEKYIERCIGSCYKQGLPEESFEVIVIDDGSTDASFSIVESLTHKHHNLRLFHQENRGQGAARNHGLKEAEGKYILFLDSDDYLIANSLQAIISEASAKNAEIAKFLIEAELPDGNVRSDHFDEGHQNRIFIGEEALYLNNNIGSVCNGIYLREFLIDKDFQFLTDIKHEDVAFEYTIYPYVKRMIYCNAVCYYYTYNASSTDRTADPGKKKLLAFSNLRISQLLKEESSDGSFPAKLRKWLLRTSNSILVSSFLESASSDYYPLKDFARDAKRLSLVPAKGRTRSWKTSLILPLINLMAWFGKG